MSSARLGCGPALLLVVSGCGLLPAGPDAGLLQVPGSYRLARMTPGHLEHQAVACRDCHSLRDAGFGSAGPEVCAGCHQAQQAQHHPFDAGAQLTCLTCHPFLSAGPPERFEKWGCMGCHAQAQGDAGLIEVHRGQCASCHRPHQAPFTRAADCTTCHQVTLKHGAKGDTVAGRCMDCHPPHSAAAVASGRCVGCHTTAAVPRRSRVEPGALFRPGHQGCGSCHLAHTFQQKAVRACEQCHRAQPVLAPKAHPACTSCHRPHEDRAQAVACESCHREVVKHPRDAQGQACLGCHPVHEKASTGRVAVPCITCHAEPSFTGKVVHAAGLGCERCHSPHGPRPRPEVLCFRCHAVQVKAAKQNVGHSKCEQCHAGLPHRPGADPRPCLSCHRDATPPQRGHARCASCHASHSAAVVKTCTSCHLGPGVQTLPGLHVVKGHARCASCHAPHVPQPGWSPATCQGCHRKLSLKAHPTAPAQCVGCHLFKRGSPDLGP